MCFILAWVVTSSHRPLFSGIRVGDYKDTPSLFLLELEQNIKVHLYSVGLIGLAMPDYLYHPIFCIECLQSFHKPSSVTAS